MLIIHFFTKIPSERSILTFMPKWVDKDIDSEIKVTPELLDSLDNPFSLKDLEAISIRLKSEEKIEANTYVKNPNVLGNKIQNSEIKITPKLLDDLDNPFDVEGLNLSPKKTIENREIM